MIDRVLCHALSIATGLPELEIQRFSCISTGHYNIYRIKQGKKLREIEEPVEALMAVQRALIPMLASFKFEPSCISRPGGSIQMNADVHEGATQILRMDIKSCYPSITRDHIQRGFISKNIPLSSELDSVLDLCLIPKGTSYKDRQYVLPTGAPTSPLLCNIALTPLDIKFNRVAKDRGLKYTRYFDDMIFSTTGERDKDLYDCVEACLKQENLKLNKKKSGWRRLHRDSLIITGVSISSRYRLQRDRRRLLRSKLQNLAHQGVTELDEETRGYLAYVQAIDQALYEKMMNYFLRRQDRRSTR